MKNSSLNSNTDPCDADAVLQQLGYQAKWEMIIMWVNHKPVDSAIKIMEFHLNFSSVSFATAWVAQQNCEDH